MIRRSTLGPLRAPTPRLLFALAFVACANDSTPDVRSVHREVAGDTIVLTFAGAVDTATFNQVRVLWQSPELDRPSSMVITGNTLVIGDRTRVHLFDLDADSVSTVGRDGDGPGEFRSIRALGVFSPDTVAVYDGRGARLTYLSPAGKFLGSHRITPHPPFINPSTSGDPLIPWRGGFLWRLTAMLAVGAVTRHAVAWHDPVADTVVVLEQSEGDRLVDLGGIFGPPETFGPAAHIAIGPGPRVARGDGLEYCITIRRLDTDTRHRLCRNRPRASVAHSLRQPDLSGVTDERRRALIEAIVRNQEIGSLLPSYDRLLFATDGSLWVRTMGPELAGVHPQLILARPEMGPAHRTWESFDVERSLLRTIHLPAQFDPQVVTTDIAYGFYTLESGEMTIGAVDIKPEL